MIAGTTRSIPDQTFFPDPKWLRKMAAGSLFARIYNHVEASSGGYLAHTFNPLRIEPHEDLPDRRGRYSSVNQPPLFDTIYLGQLVDTEATVVSETFDYKSLAYIDSDSARIIRRRMVRDWSIAYFESKRELRVVDFSSFGSCCDIYGASQEVLEGRDSSLTRMWARWVVTNVSDADGILYRSKSYGSEADGLLLVLLGEAGEGVCNYLEPYGEVRLGDPEGYRLLRDISSKTRYLPESPWK